MGTTARTAVARSTGNTVDVEGNPYVGPTPYLENDEHVFQGREFEAETLLALAVTERVVVFHAESGAGKTSLINMRLIPQLRQEAFQVFSIPHIGRSLPRGFDRNSIKNVFSFNAAAHLASLPLWCVPPAMHDKTKHEDRTCELESRQKEMPEGAETSAAATSAHFSKAWRPRKKSKKPAAPLTAASMLSEFLPTFIERHSSAVDVAGERGLPVLAHRGTVLIFDQFEELLTEYPDRWADREVFFRDVKLALDKLPFLSFVFVVRQDSLASLERYAHLMPGRLSARYRIELFTARQAIPAIRIPAEAAGRPFEPGVAEQLANNLASRQTIEGQGTYIGEFIEPVYLQVVCYGLWKRLASGPGTSISMSDLRTHGNIDNALQQFYENGVREVSQSTGVMESRIRRWFDLLVTKSGRRAQVLHEFRESGGLSNEVISLLEDRHLVRGEAVAGTKVYLLTHDRLVASVISVNARLRSGSSNPLLLPARKWEQDGFNRRHLLRGKDLRSARLWSEANPELLSSAENQFLKSSLSAEAEEAAKFRRYFLFALVATVVAFTATIIAWLSRHNAKMQEVQTQVQERQSESKSLALQALETLPIDPEKSLLLALHAVSKTYPIDQRATPEALNALAEAVHATSRLQLSIQMQAPIKKVSFSPHGHWLATLDNAGHFAIWDAVSGENLLSLPEAIYTNMAVARSDSDQTEIGMEHIVFAVSNNKNEVELEYTDSRKSPRKFLEPGAISAITFSEDGSKLMIGCQDGTIDEINLADRQSSRPFKLADSSSPILAMRYLPDRNQMLVLSSDRLTTIPGADGPIENFPLSFTVSSFAITEDAKKLLLSAGDQRIIKFEVNPAITQKDTIRVRDTISSLQFGSGDNMVVGAAGGYAMVLDSISENELLHVAGHIGKVTSTAYSSIGQRLATGGEDGKVMVWNAFPSHVTPVMGIAFSPNGSRLGAISLDGDISIWDVQSQQEINRFSLNQDAVKALLAKHSTAPKADGSRSMQIAYWPDGTRILIANGTSLVAINTESPNVSPRVFPIRASSVAFSPDGLHLAIGTLGGELLLWNPGSMRLESKKSKVKIGDSPITAVAFLPDSAAVITATQYGEVDLWNSSSLEKVVHLASVKNGVRGISINPQKHLLAAAGGDARIHLVDLNKLREEASNEGGPDFGSAVVGVAFSNDGERLASVAEDGQVRVWDLSQHRILYSYRGTAAGLHPIAFSPAEPLLAGIGSDREVLFRQIEVKDALAIARLRLTRAWTEEECEEYLDENHAKGCSPAIEGLGKLVKAKNLAQRGITEQDSKKAQQAFQDAVSLFAAASELYPVLSIDNPTNEAKEVASAAEVREIRNARMLNQWADVLQIIRSASERAEYTSEDAKFEFANQLLVASQALARLGDIDRASEAINLVDKQVGSQTSQVPVYLNNLCWFGTLWGRAKAVVQYCQKATEYSPTEVNFGDSLGLALSETDNSQAAEAIGLFEAYVAGPESSEEEKTERRSWINRIRSGKRPLTPDVRRRLIMQGLSEVKLGCEGGIESSCLAYAEAMHRASQLR